MLLMLMVLPMAAVLLAKAALSVKVTMSLVTMSEDVPWTVAFVAPSYTLLSALYPMVRAFLLMSAVVAAVVLKL